MQHLPKVPCLKKIMFELCSTEQSSKLTNTQCFSLAFLFCSWSTFSKPGPKGSSLLPGDKHNSNANSHRLIRNIYCLWHICSTFCKAVSHSLIINLILQSHRGQKRLQRDANTPQVTGNRNAAKIVKSDNCPCSWKSIIWIDCEHLKIQEVNKTQDTRTKWVHVCMTFKDAKKKNKLK